MDLDVHYILSESGDFALKGEVAANLGLGSGVLGDKVHVAATAGRVALSELDMEYGKNGTLRIAVQPEIDLDSVAFSGPIEISVDKLVELLVLLQSLSADSTVSATDTGLDDFADRSVVVPNSDVKLKKAGASSITSLSSRSHGTPERSRVNSATMRRRSSRSGTSGTGRVRRDPF